MPAIEVGQKYGRLVVLERADTDEHYNVRWRCRCDCGRETLVYRQHLRRGRTKSCGCSRGLTGEANPAWRGDEAGYDALHKWVGSRKVKTGICTTCQQERKTAWANVSHQYKRDLNDWIEMCYLCHYWYDRDYRESGN